MRSRCLWLAAVAISATISLASPAVWAQVLDPIQYTLYSQSDLTFGCTGPCACPAVTTGPISGSFTFYRTSVDPLFTHYSLLNISWSYTTPGTARIVIAEVWFWLVRSGFQRRPTRFRAIPRRPRTTPHRQL